MKNISERALNVIKMIEEKGHQAFIVGGAVRDALLGKNPMDYDITTSALPNEIIEIFSFTKVIETGIKHGTVTVIIDGYSYEITTFRTEEAYLDNRHPDNVSFINDIEKDCSRRDFTINALCFNKELKDYYNGVKDLNNKVIRCIGDPFLRFEEDSLRIIRALRFASSLGFQIEEKTKEAMHLKKDLLLNISIERVNKELFQMFENDCDYILDEYFDIFEVLFPHLKNCKKEFIEKFCKLKDKELKYCCLFFNCAEEFVDDIIKKYHLSNDIFKLIKLLNFGKIKLVDNKVIIKKILKNYSYNDIIKYINYTVSSNEFKTKLLLILDEAINECHCLSMLDINGNDLISVGITNGLEIKFTLDLLVDSVIEGKVNNKKEDLFKYINNTIKN